tara:strand:+ start:4062 stop:5573 length:1512 start_codon:yes stop_codon:yes gene_type:complete
MKIYKQEKIDGIADLVKSQSSLAYCTQANIAVDKPQADQLKKILAKSNPDQYDLYYLESVLVSTGWNKNDDVFAAQEVWSARNTPEDKQFNFMHNENDIIGHITGSYILDKKGKKVDAKEEQGPSEFDIITQAVLYNSWTDPENRDRMQNIISEIEEGKWFVSMECLFAGFDYALIDPEGKNQVLTRDESTAFLTKHLRAYGGSGEYEGYHVGRALRNISFSGKGLVSKPANPRSIILNSSKAFHVDESDIITDFQIGDVQMSDNLNLLEKQVTDLQVQLASAKEENDAMKQNIEAAKDAEFAATVEAFENSAAKKDEAIAELEETIKSTQARIAELEDALAQKSEELSEAVQTVADMKHQEQLAKRLADLVEAGLEAEEAQESLASFASLADEDFDAIVQILAKKKSKYEEKDKDDKKKKDEDKKDDKGNPFASETEAEEETETEAEQSEAEEVEAEVSEEIFDEVESSEATLVEASSEEDELQSTRANIAEWLSENVLNKK